MTALMILMDFVFAMGPYHGMMGPNHSSSPHAEMPYTHMQADRTPRPNEDKR